MCIEFMTEGKLYPTRPDAVKLKNIKRGEWSLLDVKEEAKRLFALAQEAYMRSSLPDAVDPKKVDDLCDQIARKYFDSDQNTL